jgi:hypothetical protein
MSLPTAVFLDTSILAGQQYNFASTAFTSFVALAKQRRMRLLLPDPTRREVMRQIRERSVEALRALEGARRRAPFLAKWRHYPKSPEPGLGDWEVKRIAESEWAAFLNQFEVITLGYEGINLNAIMDWYDGPRAPFGGGKKRKEFPDAFAVAALASYAARAAACIAVVSADNDFKEACAHYPSLLHFPSLPSLTEVLLADSNTIDAIRKLIELLGTKLEEAVVEAAAELPFYHTDERFDDIEDVDSIGFEADDVRVVGLGVNECTVTFSGELSFRARLRWKEFEDEYGPGWDSERVRDGARISGTAKLRLAPDLGDILDITLLALDDEEIAVTERP